MLIRFTNQELKDAYFAELTSGLAINKAAAIESDIAEDPTPGNSGQNELEADPRKAAKAKPKLKKRSREDDPFASEEEDKSAETDKTEELTKQKRAPASNEFKALPKGRQRKEDEKTERPKRIRTVK